MAKKTSRPGRTLITFFLVVGVLYGLAALGGTFKPKLGLDLEGGTRITLQAVGNGVTKTKMDQARSIIDQRANGTGVTEANVTVQGSRNIVVEIPGKNSGSLVDSVKRTAQLRFRLVAQCGGQSCAGDGSPVAPTPSATATPTATPTGKSTAKSTPTATPTTSATSTPKPRPAPKLADATPTATPTGTSTAKPTATPTPTTPAGVDKGASINDPIKWAADPGTEWLTKFAAFKCPKNGDTTPVADNPDQPLITCDPTNKVKYLLSKAVIEGTSLKSASAGIPQNQAVWAVNLALKGKAVGVFANISRTLINNGGQFAIVLDGKVLSNPGFNGVITDGSAQITGSFNEKTASSLANSLKYGALPIRFDSHPQVEIIGPSLAGDQLSAGILAGIIGLAIVMIYCLLYYRGLGLVVISSLIVAAGVTYALVLLLAKAAGFTLTLPGIAGLIVAVGITADSFIVYFERIRDEMRAGKSMRVAVESGWVRARNTCLAADAVSLIAAVVLYIFAIGVVRGFAFALGLSTLIDLAVFFWFTKPSVTLLARRPFFNSGHRFSGLSAETLGIDGDHPAAVQAGLVGGKA
ncbi:protein translocase subunit SecD [Nocardioides marmorisolisilvae]|uniref:Protein translocase subunit SecD n=1 Tax=Nocardioides marmorisolisilvae TaxID=1542737 RepID=A0A3N0DUJ4_9ACTN|nr:protein translocase subunit SecD [Nocardioides marmorisolisilvae]RNL79201.1 protein translocase subunit SecD [Nocardioides marmorisolisilvae]